MEDLMLNALRHILYWNKLNKNKTINKHALNCGYINQRNQLTLRGFKYIAKKIYPKCVIANCPKDQAIKCFCAKHYQQYYRGARGESLIYVQEKPSKRLMVLLEKICRNSVPTDISLLLKERKFMNLVEEGIEKELLYFYDKNLIQITPQGLTLLD